MPIQTNIARQLTITQQESDAWDIVRNLATGGDYVVPVNARSIVNGFRITNHSASAVTVTLAVDRSISDDPAPILYGPKALVAGESITISDLVVIPAEFALWFRAVGTTPLVVMNAPALECFFEYQFNTGYNEAAEPVTNTIGYIYNTETRQYHPLTAIGVGDQRQTDLGPGVSALPLPSPHPALEYPEFPDVGAMISSPTADWLFATCKNYEGTDGVFSFWVRTTETNLDPSLSESIAALSAGGFARRITTS